VNDDLANVMVKHGVHALCSRCWRGSGPGEVASSNVTFQKDGRSTKFAPTRQHSRATVPKTPEAAGRGLS
jgi:hypothetical protein